MRRSISIILGILFLGVTISADAATEVGKSWGDWTQVCFTPDPGQEGTDFCRVTQTASLNFICKTEVGPNQQTVLRDCRMSQGAEPGPDEQLMQRRAMQTTIGYVPESDKPVIFITAPLGVFIPRGIMLSVEGADSVTFPIQRCDSNGCLGNVAIESDLFDALRKQDNATITFFTSTTQDMSLPLSLKGFSKAARSIRP